MAYERSEVRAPWPSAKNFPVRPDLTQSISILLYDRRTFPFGFFFFSGNQILNIHLRHLLTFSGPARAIAYGPHTGIFSIVLHWKRARGRTDHMIIFNYAPKGRWIVVDIYRDAKRRGIYRPLFTDPKGDSSFSMYQIRWIKIILF